MPLTVTAAGPHHSLGGDDEDDFDFDRQSGAFDARSLDAQASELLGDFEKESAREDRLVKLSEADKAHQHQDDRIPELDTLLAEDDEMREADQKAEAMRRELEDGAKAVGAGEEGGALLEMGDLLEPEKASHSRGTS